MLTVNHLRVPASRLALLLVAGFWLTGCDDDSTEDAIAEACDTAIQCDYWQLESECTAFYEKAFSDLEERCSNVTEVSARYREALSCITDAPCDTFLTGCEMELEAYDTAKAAGGATCEPDDD